MAPAGYSGIDIQVGRSPVPRLGNFEGSPPPSTFHGLDQGARSFLIPCSGNDPFLGEQGGVVRISRSPGTRRRSYRAAGARFWWREGGIGTCTSPTARGGGFRPGEDCSTACQRFKPALDPADVGRDHRGLLRAGRWKKNRDPLVPTETHEPPGAPPAELDARTPHRRHRPLRRATYILYPLPGLVPRDETKKTAPVGLAVREFLVPQRPRPTPIQQSPPRGGDCRRRGTVVGRRWDSGCCQGKTECIVEAGRRPASVDTSGSRFPTPSRPGLVEQGRGHRVVSPGWSSLTAGAGRGREL